MKKKIVVFFTLIILNFSFEIANSEIFISLSRGSQVWDFYKEEWAELAPMICVGPPHSFFIFPHQVRIIFSLVTFFKFPLAISKISKYLKQNEEFMFTYGDGVSNVNIKNLVTFHKKNKKLISS